MSSVFDPRSYLSVTPNYDPTKNPMSPQSTIPNSDLRNNPRNKPNTTIMKIVSFFKSIYIVHISILLLFYLYVIPFIRIA